MVRKKIIITKKLSAQKSITAQHATQMKHKYSKYYPSILDPHFTSKITHHPIFKKYKLTIDRKKLDELYRSFETNIPMADDTKKTNTNIYILKPTQKLLRNFMSPYTPYRGLMIYHEMGVGKTCTAITIAETLKHITQNSNTKIYIIRPEEVARQIFDINEVKRGRPLLQCTGDTYLQNPKNAVLMDRCITSGDDVSCDQLKSRIEKDIRQIYEFKGARAWAGDIEREIEQKTRNIPAGNKAERTRRIRSIIGQNYDNAVIIVDEAHELRESNEADAKKVPPILKLVLENASNLRLIFLTATPIYDKPQNIVSLINYFLINDKRPIMRENDIFDQEGNLKPTGQNILVKNTRGYVSFLRGSDPFLFPIRLSARYNIPRYMINLAKYPGKNIIGDTIEKDNVIKHLELVDCPMRGKQLEIMKYHISNDKINFLSDEELESLSESLSSYEDSITGDSLTDANTDSVDTSNSLDIKLENKAIRDDKDIKKIAEPEYRDRTVAYLFERQISNVVFQSLNECNKNIKLSTGNNALSQIVSKQKGKWTYQFHDPTFAKRFKLPELYNWSSKIARAVELIMNSTGPVFVYTYFNIAGIIPLAFALEMCGYKRYKQHETPLIESDQKDPTYRGDYIIYTGDATISQYAQEYLDKRQKMIYEKNVKVFIGTSKASEGLNLFGYREVHILDPWHNINLIEQSIGRVIRTGSHMHLPPQERNVSVYLYATTMGEIESFDMIIYKLCEKKAIKAGVIEKILKENAFDCDLNKALNVYSAEDYNRMIPQKTSHNKMINISLADVEYSRPCFYMKDCNFQCLSISANPNTDANSDMSRSDFPTPIMKFNYDKEVYEIKNLILQLLSSNPNLKIANLRAYLQKMDTDSNPPENLKKSKKQQTSKKQHTKTLRNIQSGNIQSGNVDQNNLLEWEDEEAFQEAIQEIINTDTVIYDKFKRIGKVALSGEYLRFIPENSLSPNVGIQKQMAKPVQLRSEIDLKMYITRLAEEHKRATEEQVFNYDDILAKVGTQIEHMTYGLDEPFNLKIKPEEVADWVFSKLNYIFKITILKKLLTKYIKGEKITTIEAKIQEAVKFHIISISDVFPSHDHGPKQNLDKSIYGFIICNGNRLELFILNDSGEFEKNQGNLKKVIELRKNQMSKTPYSKLYGFLRYEKDKDSPVFKIMDIASKGEKKSVSGSTCITENTNGIKKNLNRLDDKILKSKTVNVNKRTLCNDVELLLKQYDARKHENKKWYYKPEEFLIYFGNQS
jgi:hypothetical protein